LKSVLQQVLHCARQRQNLQGTRLWYPHDTGASKPALVIRLGCDVERSLAQVAGDAGVTCPRREEAPERPSNGPTRDAVFRHQTLSDAAFRSDLTPPPPLGHAMADTPVAGQRHEEGYGGTVRRVDFPVALARRRRSGRHHVGVPHVLEQVYITL
jgi:hypothetical protein